MFGGLVQPLVAVDVRRGVRTLLGDDLRGWRAYR